jgi:predicted DsbA family dithiol-disulfide isomerase
MSAPVTLTIEIWSDVMCPWCIIGYKQLQKALAGLAGEIEADIRWHPFELNPDMPDEGEDIGQHMLRKYGQAPSEGGMGRMQQIAEHAGYEMRYLGEGEEPPRMIWNTRRAHMLLYWALDAHGAEAQTRLKLALFDAHFQQRRNVSDPATLLDIAESAGLDRAGAEAALNDDTLAQTVQREEMEAMGMGITSVPMMLVEKRFMIPGAQEPEVYEAYLRKVVNRMQDAD